MVSERTKPRVLLVPFLLRHQPSRWISTAPGRRRRKRNGFS
jgi:hypothetical protein